MASPSLGSWTATTTYPLGAEGLSCPTYNGYVYCVGGYNGAYVANTYYAAISSSGIGAWAPSTPYPTALFSPSCVAYNGYIYCTRGSPDTSLSYYATISSGGIGSWTSTTSYPISGYSSGSGCVADNGYIYCVSGKTGGGGSTLSYSASLSSSGIGTWSATTSYPIAVWAQTCKIYSGKIYCAGGYPNTNAAYYATVSSGNIGSWIATNSYPLSVYPKCVVYNGYDYCVGGGTSGADASGVANVYYAPISAGGIGGWISTTSYPVAINSQQCGLT